MDPMDIDKHDLSGKSSVEEEFKKLNESEDEQDEILILTPEDQEELFKQIVIEEGLEETNKGDKEFEEEISDRLGELHRKQQLNIDITLQTSQVQLETSTQNILIPEQEEGEKDDAEEQSKVHMVTVDIMPH